MTDKDQTTWLTTLVQTAQNGSPDTAHLKGPKLTREEWLVVAQSVGVVLANDPTLELTGKYTQDGHEPGETDVFHEYLDAVREPDGSYVFICAHAFRSPDGCYVPGTVSRIIDTVFNTVVDQHHPNRGPNLHIYLWALEVADALAKSYSDERSKVAAQRLPE